MGWRPYTSCETPLQNKRTEIKKQFGSKMYYEYINIMNESIYEALFV